jgi:tRNA(Arg) A34 adenosine deaminase TadA
VLVQHGQVIGQGFNRPIIDSDPSAHAEMVAIRAAARRPATTGCPAAPCT